MGQAIINVKRADDRFVKSIETKSDGLCFAVCPQRDQQIGTKSSCHASDHLGFIGVSHRFVKR